MHGTASAARCIPTRVGAIVFTDEGAGWRVVRVDGPGFGESDPLRGEVHAGDYAEVVLELRDAAFMAGCSWGGQSAAHVAVRAPASPARCNPRRRARRTRSAFSAAFASFVRVAMVQPVRTVMTRSLGPGDVLPRLAVPTTLLMYAEDALYPVARMRPLAERSPGAGLEVTCARSRSTRTLGGPTSAACADEAGTHGARRYDRLARPGGGTR